MNIERIELYSKAGGTQITRYVPKKKNKRLIGICLQSSAGNTVIQNRGFRLLADRVEIFPVDMDASILASIPSTPPNQRFFPVDIPVQDEIQIELTSYNSTSAPDYLFYCYLKFE